MCFTFVAADFGCLCRSPVLSFSRKECPKWIFFFSFIVLIDETVCSERSKPSSFFSFFFFVFFCFPDGRERGSAVAGVVGSRRTLSDHEGLSLPFRQPITKINESFTVLKKHLHCRTQNGERYLYLFLLSNYLLQSYRLFFKDLRSKKAKLLL